MTQLEKISRLELHKNDNKKLRNRIFGMYIFLVNRRLLEAAPASTALMHVLRTIRNGVEKRFNCLMTRFAYYNKKLHKP